MGFGVWGFGFRVSGVHSETGTAAIVISPFLTSYFGEAAEQTWRKLFGQSSRQHLARAIGSKRRKRPGGRGCLPGAHCGLGLRA